MAATLPVAGDAGHPKAVVAVETAKFPLFEVAICTRGCFVYLRDRVTKSLYLTFVFARAAGQVSSPTLSTSPRNAAWYGVPPKVS